MATTAPSFLHNMHHFRSSSDTHPHKLHKHKSFSHITFTETGKTEELRDDQSSQSSNNDAKSDLSRKGSVKRTVKKVKKYLSRRFSGHHPHHDEANYSIMSGGLVGAQFAYAAMGRPASTPSSPSGSRSGGDRFSPLGEELHPASVQDTIVDDPISPDALIDGVHPSQPSETSDMAIQTPDNTFQFITDDADAVQVSDSFDQSFDSVDSRDSVAEPHEEPHAEPHDDSLNLPDINIPVPQLPPTPPTLSQEIPAQEEAGEPLDDNSGSDPQSQEEETPIEASGSTTDDLTIINSIESLRSLDEVPDAEPLASTNEAPLVEELQPASESSELQELPAPTADPETKDDAETKESPEVSHEAEVSSPPDAMEDESRFSENDKQAIEVALPNKEAKAEGVQTKPHPPTAYAQYDDELGDMSFDVFNVSYLKATVVALAASGLGVMLANGVYRLFRA